MFKTLILILLFLSISSFAATAASPVDAKHPFLKIGMSADKSASVYIGAFGEMLPTKTDKGDVLLIAMMIEDIADADHPKGARYEYAIAADCKQQIAKILMFWKKPDENLPGVSRYDLTGDALSNKITSELNKQPVNDIEPGSFVAIAVNSACHYLGIDATQPKHKPREWSAML